MSTYPAPEPNPTFKPQEVLPGQVFLNRYQVARVLGRGAMGEVLEVLDKHSGLSYALKRVPPELVRDVAQMRAIQANFALVSQLAHPNIATTRHLELDTATGHAYLILELVRGTDLNYWILDQRDRRGQHDAPLPVPTVLGIAEQIASALDFAHALPVSRGPDGKPSRYGILHRDLKPANVMLDTAREFRPGIPYVKLVDFGLAAEIQASMMSLSVAPQRENTAGTLSYMSPEQWEGRTLTRGIDQWALAVVIFEMAAGRKPFVAGSAQALFVQVKNANPEQPASLSSAQWAALRKALHPDRRQRYRSCVEFVKALAAADKATEGSIVSAEMPMPDEFAGVPPSSVPEAIPATAPDPKPAPIPATAPPAPPPAAAKPAAQAAPAGPVPVPLAPIRMQPKDFGLPMPQLPAKLPAAVSPVKAKSGASNAAPLLILGACVIVLAVLGSAAWYVLGQTGKKGNHGQNGPIAKTGEADGEAKTEEPQNEIERLLDQADIDRLTEDLKPLSVIWEEQPDFELWYMGTSLKNEGARRSGLAPPGGWLEILAPGSTQYHELRWKGQPEIYLRQTGDVLETAEHAGGPWRAFGLDARQNTGEILKTWAEREGNRPSSAIVPDMVFAGTFEALKKLRPESLVYLDPFDCVQLAQLPSLRRLSLSQTNVQRLDGFPAFKQLTALDLSFCPELTHIGGLETLDGLETLLLNGCPKLEDLTALRTLKRLRELYLPPTVGNGSLTVMRTDGVLNRLTVFGASGARNVSSAEALKGLTGLRGLDFSDCSDAFDPATLEGFGGLCTLDLPPSVTGPALKRLRKSGTLTTLASLSVTNAKSLEGAGALDGLRNLPRLTSLKLDGCTNLDDAAPLLALPSLTELSLRGCSGFYGSDALPKLRGLRRFTAPPSLTEDALKRMRNEGALDDLVYLELNECNWIASVAPLSGLTALRKLVVRSCANIKQDALRKLRDEMPQLAIVGLEDAPPAPAQAPAEKLPGEAVPKDGQAVKTASGLAYYEILEGTGAQAGAGDEVMLDYTIYLEKDGTKAESTTELKDVPKFKLNGELFAGLDEGVKGMKEGGRRKLVVPANLAYGETGTAKIPANAALVVDVCLFTVRKAKMAEEKPKEEIDPLVLDHNEVHNDNRPAEILGDKLPQGAKAVESATGLRWYVMKNGTGAASAPGDDVEISYRLHWTTGEQWGIDDTLDTKKPWSLTLGKKTLVAGFEEGLLGMRAGEKRKLVVPPHLAYGDKGYGKTPAHATLVIDVEALRVTKAAAASSGDTQDLAAPTSMTVQQFPVPVGTFLRKGQSIGQVTGANDGALKVRVETAKAALEKAKTELAEADKAHNRNLELQKQAVVTNQEVLASAMKQKAAQLRQEAAQEDLANAQKMLAQGGQLIMPFDGVVVKYHAEIGQTIQAGQPFISVKKQAAPKDPKRTDNTKTELPPGVKTPVYPKGPHGDELAEDGDQLALPMFTLPASNFIHWGSTYESQLIFACTHDSLAEASLIDPAVWEPRLARAWRLQTLLLAHPAKGDAETLKNTLLGLWTGAVKTQLGVTRIETVGTGAREMLGVWADGDGHAARDRLLKDIGAQCLTETWFDFLTTYFTKALAQEKLEAAALKALPNPAWLLGSRADSGSYLRLRVLGTAADAAAVEKALLAELKCEALRDSKVQFLKKKTWPILERPVHTFYLNPSARWHDGTALSAQDVLLAWKIKRVFATASTDFRAWLLECEDVRAEEDGPAAVTFTWSAPGFDVFSRVASMAPVASHLCDAETWGDIQAKLTAAPVTGTGPWKVLPWKAGDTQIILERNNAYYGKRPHLANLALKQIPQPQMGQTYASQSMKALEDGLIDYSQIPDEFVAEKRQLKAYREKFRFLVQPSDRGRFVFWNRQRALFQDKRVRQALSLAIDRESLCRTLYPHERALPFSSYIDPLGRLKNSGPATAGLPFDASKAKRLLGEAGWSDQDRDGYLDKNGKRLSFQVLSLDSSAESKAMCEALAGQLKAVGVELVTVSKTNAEVSDLINKGEYDALFGSLLLAISFDDFAPYLSRTDGAPEPGFSCAELDRIAAEARWEGDEARVRKLAEEFNALLLGEMPVLPIVVTQSCVAYDARIQNLRPSSSSGYISSLSRAWAPKKLQKYK